MAGKGKLRVNGEGRYHDVDDDDWSFGPCPCLSAHRGRAEVHFVGSPSPLIRATPRLSILTIPLERVQTKLIMAHKAPLVVPALKRHTATVIVAHGLGDSGAGW